MSINGRPVSRRAALTAGTPRNLSAQDLAAQQPMVEEQMQFTAPHTSDGSEPRDSPIAPEIPPPAQIVPFPATVVDQEIRNFAVVGQSTDPIRDTTEDLPLPDGGLWRYNLNYVLSPPDPRDAKYRVTYRDIIDENALPPRADLRDKWGAIMDQGELGSCVANTVSGCIRAVRAKDGLTVFDPSRLYIYYYGRLIEGFDVKEDTGMYIRSGYKAVAAHSVCSERNWPYRIVNFDDEPSEVAKKAASQHRTFKYLNLEDPIELKHSLSQGYPISFGTEIKSSMMSAEVARTGIVPMPRRRERTLGGHAMTLVGYDDDKKHYIVANSWGSNWGDRGFCYMPYDYIHDTDMTGDFWTPRQFM